MEAASHLQVLQFIWKYTKRHLWVIALMTVLMFMNTGLTLVQPFFYRAAVDIAATSNVGDPEAMKGAMLLVIYGVLCGVVSLTCHELASFLLGRIEIPIMTSAHADVFAYIQRLSTKFHINTFAGSTARKINRGVEGIETIIDILWFNFIPLIVFTIGLAIVFASFVPLVGMVLIAGILLYAVYAICVNLVLMRYYSWADRQDTKLTASLVDAITGNALVKAFAAERREEDRHGNVLSEWGHRWLFSWRVANFITWTQFMLLMSIELAALLLSVWLWYKGEFSAGSFIVMLFFIGQMWGRLFDIGNKTRQYLRGVTNCEEMVGMTYKPLEVEDAPDAKDLEVSKGAIDFHTMTFRYENQEHDIFKDFELSIKPGEKIALVGHSGGGKSTIVKLLLRLYDLQKGSISIDGQDIAHVTQESLRNSMSLVPQDPVLFHRTIAENISYAAPGATKEEIEKAAKLGHAEEFIVNLPQTYDTLVGERGVKLSGGERQRVAISRAILANKPILLLDEATSSLDSVSEKHIQEALEYLMQNRTTIVIAHRLGTVRTVDRIVVLDKGELIACAPHDELIETCEIYREMVELQSHGMLGA